jgi:hypothetical protein
MTMLAHIPTWVFFLFAGLFALGLWLGRPRAVSPRPQLIVAIGFQGYSLWGVISAFGVSAVSLLLWAVGVILSVSALRGLFGPRGLARGEVPSKVFVPGSWAPLALIMGVFLGRFLIGFAQGARLPLATHSLFAPGVSVALGMLSGGFAARAIAVHRFAVRSQGEV